MTLGGEAALTNEIKSAGLASKLTFRITMSMLELLVPMVGSTVMDSNRRRPSKYQDVSGIL